MAGSVPGAPVAPRGRPRGGGWQATTGDFGDKGWREDGHLAWTRVAKPESQAKLGSGKLELERQFTPENPEPISTKLGTYTAEKLALMTTGRVINTGAPPDAKPMEMPANWVSTFWVTPGAGIVQTLNPYAHMYQLTQVTLK